MMTDVAAQAGLSERSSALTEGELTAVAGGIVYFGPIWKRDPRPTPPQPLPPPTPNSARRLHALEHDPEKWNPVFGKDHAPPRT